MTKGDERGERVLSTHYGARAPYVRHERRHKYKVGEIVTIARAPMAVRLSNIKRDTQAAKFKITRLLPEEERSFFYRIKDAVTGQERVVAEEGILATCE